MCGKREVSRLCLVEEPEKILEWTELPDIKASLMTLVGVPFTGQG
jgi:hypothetical protein